MGEPLQVKYYILGESPYGVNNVLYRGRGIGNICNVKSYVSEVGQGTRKESIQIIL
jgi:hypothetical protein